MAKKKHFTVDEANELLPLIEQNITTIQEMKETFEHTLQQLQSVKNVYHQGGMSNAESEHVFKLECQLDFMEIEAQVYVNNIETVGAEIKDIDLGLVDFPAIIDEEEVLLCWKQGESKV